MNDQKECQGENCTAVNDVGHSPECQFEHFLSYMGYQDKSDEERVRLKVAYLHGFFAAGLSKGLNREQ